MSDDKSRPRDLAQNTKPQNTMTTGYEWPKWCATHQSWKWCEHNGGVMGPTGYESPEAATKRTRSGENSQAASVPGSDHG
jgi:hypothetical protein